MAPRAQMTRVSSRLTRFGGEAGVGVRLVCLPYAGATTTVYRNWAARLPAAVELLGADPPGRVTEQQGAEPSEGLLDVATVIAGEIAALPRVPTVLFGHSLGALLAYETAVELMLHGVPIDHLVVSGCVAPHKGEKATPLHGLGQEEFFAAWNDSLGLPEIIRGSTEVQVLVYPMMKYDIWLYDTYEWERHFELECPVTAFGGSSDHLSMGDSTRHWRDLTSGEFRLRLFPGDHFFLHSHEREVVGSIGALLSVMGNAVGPRP